MELSEDRLSARGVQINADEGPYAARYELETRERFETARLVVDVLGEGRLELACDGDGHWSANGEAREDLAGALDCDLAFSPLTNTMPILRGGHARGGEPRNYEMAWVALPDLAVHRDPQRYEPIDAGRARFVSRDSDFRAVLELDDDGLLVRYEHLAERVTP